MRWKAVCAYDGRYFSGWQSQPNGRAVQDVIEDALQKILRERIRIHGSSRTDSGVHAKEQVFHFDADWPHPPERFQAALRTMLPETLVIKNLRKAAKNFHARYSAAGKRYRYYIHQGWPDPFEAPFRWSLQRELHVEPMREAATWLIGTHDFTSFAALSGRENENPVKTLQVLTVDRRGPRFIITAEGSGFMYKMVRSLVGGLVHAGIGKLTPGRIGEILAERQRTAEIETAPPGGLFLEKVFYRTPPHWK